ncbi:hypothetical protein KW785_03045 [Candidatus Parcubacteria bacterium]|nr:hypothetical protein [Candidatus Parcubacteria bacterium]
MYWLSLLLCALAIVGFMLGALAMLELAIFELPQARRRKTIDRETGLGWCGAHLGLAKLELSIGEPFLTYQEEDDGTEEWEAAHRRICRECRHTVSEEYRPYEFRGRIRTLQ